MEGEAVEAALSDGRSCMLLFCHARSNLDAGRSFVAALHKIRKRANPKLVKRLEALEVVLEAIGGLRFESFSEGVFLPFVCSFKLAHGEIDSLFIESVAPNCLYSPQDECAFPLAYLFYLGADDNFCSTVGLEKSPEPPSFFSHKFKAEEKEKMQKFLLQFRNALEDLGSTEEEIIQVLRNMAKIFSAYGAQKGLLETNKSSVAACCAKNYKTYQNILKLVQRAFGTGEMSTSTEQKGYSNNEKTIILAQVPCVSPKHENDCNALYHNLLADFLLMNVHTMDLKLLPDIDEFFELSKPNKCTWNILAKFYNRKIGLQKWFQTGIDENEILSYQHYLGSVKYHMSQSFYADLGQLENIMGILTKTISPIFELSPNIRAVHLWTSTDVSQKTKNGRVMCASYNCHICIEMNNIELGIEKLADQAEACLKGLLGKERVIEIQNLVQHCATSDAPVELKSSCVDKDPDSFLFKIELSHTLLQNWSKEALEFFQKSSESILYRMVKNIDYFVDFSNFSTETCRDFINEIPAFKRILQLKKQLLPKHEKKSVTDFKTQIKKMFDKLPQEIIQSEITFIKRFKMFLIDITPNTYAELNLEAFCKDDKAGIPYLQRQLQELAVAPDLAEELQGLKEFRLIVILKDLISSFLQVVRVKEFTFTKVLEVKGVVVELRLVQPQLAERLRLSDLQEVRIEASEVLHIDISLDGPEWAGVDIFLKAPFIKVHGNRKIDVSGMPSLIDHATAETAADGTGLDGKNGVLGKHGGDITISAIQVINGKGLHVISNGGAGGNGQSGGNGRNGNDGLGLDKKRLRKSLNTKIKTTCDPQEILKKMKRRVKDGGYLEVEEEETGLRMVYNYERSKLMNTSTFFISFGTPGTVGKSGGIGGLGGEGGRCGSVTVPTFDINVQTIQGIRGEDGTVGKHGSPGRNGWDVGYHDCAFWNKALYYGLAKNRKLRIIRHATDGPRRSKCKYLNCYVEISSEIFPSPVESFLLGVHISRTSVSTEQVATFSPMEKGHVRTKRSKDKKRKLTEQRSATLRRLLLHSKSMPGIEKEVPERETLSEAMLEKDIDPKHAEWREKLITLSHNYEELLNSTVILQLNHFCEIGHTHKRSDFNNHCIRMIEDKTCRLTAMKIVTSEFQTTDVLSDLRDTFKPYIEQRDQIRNEISDLFKEFESAFSNNRSLNEAWIEFNTYNRSREQKSCINENIDYTRFEQSLRKSTDGDLIEDDVFLGTLVKYLRLMNDSLESFLKVISCMPNDIWKTIPKLDGVVKTDLPEVILSTEDISKPHKIVQCFGSSDHLFCLLDTGNVCSVIYDANFHKLVNKRYVHSIAKGFLLADGIDNQMNLETMSRDSFKILGSPYKFGLICKCLSTDKKIIMKAFRKSRFNALISSYVKVLSLEQFNQYCWLHIIAERLFNDTTSLKTEEILFIMEYIITSHSQAASELLLMQWVFVTNPTSEWVMRLTIFHVENHLRMEISDSENLSIYLQSIKRNDILMLFNEYLRNDSRNSNVNRKLLDKIFSLLAVTKDESIELQNLDLREWPYVLKIAALKAELRSSMEHELDEAVTGIIRIEQRFGEAKAKQALSTLSRMKTDADSLEVKGSCKLLEDLLSEDVTISNCNGIEKLVHTKNEDASVAQIIKAVTSLECSISKGEEMMLMIDGMLRSIDVKTNQFGADTAIKLKTLQKILKQELQSKSLAAFIKALELVDMKILALHGYRLRNTQKVAILIMLLNNKGAVLQVATGEGKSLIVASFAIIKVLMGLKVDIITSSPVLARRDAESMQSLYSTFDIIVSHNCHEAVEERKKAYETSSVIYGEISSFQRDYLLDTFYNKNIFQSRNFTQHAVIVDEVDSMLLDKGNNMLYLSHEISGFDKLQTVYVYIWNRINRPNNGHLTLSSRIQKIKDELVLDMYGLIRESDVLKLDNSVSTSNSKDLLAALTSLKIIDYNGKLLIKEVDDKLPEKLEKKLGFTLRHLVPRLIFLIQQVQNRITDICIPKYFYPFVELHMEKWIESAINAQYMVEKEDYIVDVDRGGTRLGPRIVILDRDTGTDMKNSQWDEALHQFIQLKHGLHLTSLTLKAVFISNTSYLKMYSELCGLTGTLGSMREKQLLREIYNIDYATLPPNRRKQFRLFKPALLPSREEWTNEIRREVRRVLQENRSILIICETVEDVTSLSKELKGENVFTYTRDYEEFIYADGRKQLPPGIIILSTNLAGRGTDVTLTDALSKSGGLHVCVSYLPANDRVEQQALGRAARCGEPGSGRIICYSEQPAGSFYSLLVQRLNVEIRRISEIRKFYETQIELEELCLQRFKRVYEEFRMREVGHLFKNLPRGGKRIFEKVFVAADKREEAVIKEVALDILQSQCLDEWAFWLDSKGKAIEEADTEEKRQLILGDLDAFLGDVAAKDWQSLITKNPWACVKFIKLLAHGGSVELAFDLCDSVIDNEPLFSYSARYYLSLAAIGQSIDSKFDLRLEQHLKMAKGLLHQQKRATDICTLHVTTKKIESPGIMSLAAYEEQQTQIKAIYDAFLESIDQMLGKEINYEDIIPKNDENQSFDVKIIPQIVEALSLANIIHPSSINPQLDLKIINDLAFERGVSAMQIREILEKLKTTKQISRHVILKEFKRLHMPGRENFWSFLKKGRNFSFEIKVACISKSELQCYDPELYEKIAEGLTEKKITEVNMPDLINKLSDCHFLMQLYDWDESKKDEDFLIEKSLLQKLIGRDVTASLEKVQLLLYNKIARVDASRLKEFHAPLFDAINTSYLELLKIPPREISAIIEYLSKTSVLKQENDQLRLQIRCSQIDDIKVEPFPIYKNAIVTTLDLSFAFRAAVEKISEDVENGSRLVNIPLPERLHISLYESLVESNQIKSRAVSRTALCEKKVANALGKIVKSKDQEGFNKYIFEFLQKCQSVLVTEKALHPRVGNVCDYIPQNKDLEVSVQFEANAEGEIIEWQQAAPKKPFTSMLDAEMLLTIGKVLYVSQKLLEKVSDEKSSNAKHDELFRVEINDKFDRFFDHTMIVLLNKLFFVVRFLLAWFFPRTYLVTKFSLAVVQSGMLHALDLIAKIHSQNSISQKTQYNDLLRLGSQERNVREKMNSYKLNIQHSAAYELVDRRLKFFTESITKQLVLQSREAANKIQARFGREAYSEELLIGQDDDIQLFLKQVFNSIRSDIESNLSAKRLRQCWRNAEGIDKVIYWSEEREFMERALCTFERIFSGENLHEASNADADKKWSDIYEARLKALIADCITKPLLDLLRPKLREVLSRDLSALTDSEEDAPNQPSTAIKVLGSKERERRKRFEMTVWKLLEGTREPEVLALAIQEDIPLRGDCIVGLFSTVERFLQNMKKEIVLNNKFDNKPLIPGTLMVYLDIKQDDFIPVMGTKSLFSEISDQADFGPSEQFSREKFVSYVIQESHNVKKMLGGLKRKRTKALSPITSNLIASMKEHITIVGDILQGKRECYDVDARQICQNKIVDYLKGFSPEALEIAFERAADSATMLFMKIITTMEVAIDDEHFIRNSIENSFLPSKFELLTLEEKVDGFVPGIHATEKATYTRFCSSGYEFKLKIRLWVHENAVCYSLSDASEEMDKLKEQVQVNNQNATGIGCFPPEVEELFKGGRVFISKIGEKLPEVKPALVRQVVLPPVIQKKRYAILNDGATAEDSC